MTDQFGTSVGQDIDQMRRRNRALTQAIHGIDRALDQFVSVISAHPPGQPLQPTPPQAPGVRSVGDTLASFGPPPIPQQPHQRPQSQEEQSGPPPIEERFVRPADIGRPRQATNEGAR